MSRVVAGTLLLPNGQPMANASIYFTAKRTEPVSIIEGSNTFFTTNNAGVYNQSVVNGFYAVSIEYIADASGAYSRRWQLGDVFIETGAPTTLEALIIASTVPDDIALGVFYQILEEAQAAAASAAASAEAAADSAASIDTSNFATAAQGAKADSAIQVAELNTRLGTAGNLGTAAQRDSDEFATEAQGAKADSAIQTATLNVRLGTAGNLGTAAQKNAGVAVGDVPDNSQLNIRLATSGNLGSAAQKNIGSAANEVPDNAQLNTRIGTTANLGNLALQNANSVAFTGGTINGVAVGATVRSSGAFTAIETTGDAGFGVAPSGVARLQSANGIKLGNTANPDPTVFDYYDEGVFTPTPFGTSTAGAPSSYSYRLGSFQRRGNRCRAEITIGWSGHTGTGNLRIAGLPFLAKNLPGYYSVTAHYLPIVRSAGDIAVGFVASATAHVAFDILSSAGGTVAMALPANQALAIIVIEYEV